MADRQVDGSAAETALAGIERLLEAGDGQGARFGLELLGPSFGVLADDDQIRRLNAVAEALGEPGFVLPEDDNAPGLRGP